ncbi:MAG: ABC transporter ATP-binding protein [Candidatus Eisenbacteria sp.]|nr:ABC transporter ATP-binding protein [Candidatus Eisenbacteria bacterium]
MRSSSGVVVLENVGKTFRMGGTPFQPPRSVDAVREVSLSIDRRESLGLVGESGSGKTTVARIMVGLLEPTRGSVCFEGRDLFSASAGELRMLRRHLQIVFQDPESALDPRQTVFQALFEVLQVHGLIRSGKGREQIRSLLKMVDIRWEDAHRYPHQLSGGQCQRVGIARALALEPSVLVADEPVSQLDVSTQAQIVSLLADLRGRLGLTVVLIAHDLSVVRQVVDRVAVMLGGWIVEMAPTEDLFSRPLHPYTRTLLEAVPRARPFTGSFARTASRPLGQWSAPRSPAACPFAPRCPDGTSACAARIPDLAPADNPAHLVRCRWQ